MARRHRLSYQDLDTPTALAVPSPGLPASVPALPGACFPRNPDPARPASPSSGRVQVTCGPHSWKHWLSIREGQPVETPGSARVCVSCAFHFSLAQGITVCVSTAPGQALMCSRHQQRPKSRMSERGPSADSSRPPARGLKEAPCRPGDQRSFIQGEGAKQRGCRGAESVWGAVLRGCHQPLRKQSGKGKEDPGLRPRHESSRRPGQLLRYVIYKVLFLLKQLDVFKSVSDY